MWVKFAFFIKLVRIDTTQRHSMPFSLKNTFYTLQYLIDLANLLYYYITFFAIVLENLFIFYLIQLTKKH